MKGDLVCVHGPLSLRFEFAAVEESRATVNLSLRLHCSTAEESVEWAVHDVRVAHDVLNRFERELASAEPAVLASQTGMALLRVSESARGGVLDAGRNSTDADRSARAGASVITPAGLKRSFERAFREYAKWWDNPSEVPATDATGTATAKSGESATATATATAAAPVLNAVTATPRPPASAVDPRPGAPATLATFVDAVARCVATMQETATYVWRELANTHTLPSHRYAVEQMCEALTGDVFEIRSEAGDLSALAQEAGAPEVRMRVERIHRWLGEHLPDCNRAVTLLAGAAQDDPRGGGAYVLVAESVAKVLLAYAEVTRSRAAYEAACLSRSLAT